MKTIQRDENFKEDIEDIEKKQMEIIHIAMIRNKGQNQESFNELPEEQKIILKHLEKKFYGRCDYRWIKK